MPDFTISQEVAQHLLSVKAIQLRPDQPFKWASGWNSPIYCDNRISLSYPEVRTYIKNCLSAAVKAYFPEVEIIAGVATAGIAQGALVADYLDLPFCYVRPEPKKHGMKNQIEGKLPEGSKVVVIEETYEPEYFKDKRLQVSIFMSPINVHVNRNPISGIIKYMKYHPGKYLVAWHPKSSTENERTTMVIGNEKGEILLRQIAGALARRICYYVKEGDQVKQNDEFGFIRFGSRVDIYLPLGSKVDVSIGQVVKGGVTVVSHMK